MHLILPDFQNLFLEVAYLCCTVLKLQAISCVEMWLFIIYSDFLCERITQKKEIRKKWKNIMICFQM